MHPTDTLLSLSHARIARAAAAGPRKATQPTIKVDTSGAQTFAAQLDRYLAARADGWTRVYDKLDEAVSAGCTVTDVRREKDHIVATLSFDAGAAIERLKALAQHDADLSGSLDAAL